MTDLDLTRYEGHTPGPWTTEDVMGDGPIDVCGPRIHEAGFPNLIATALTDKGVGGDVLRGLAEAIANARLIADAPLLLAEVRRLREENADQRETINHWRVKAECYGAMVRGCKPALDAAGFTVDASGTGGAVEGVKRSVEALAARLNALRQSHARLLAAIKSTMGTTGEHYNECLAGRRGYGDCSHVCRVVKAAVAEAEAL